MKNNTPIARILGLYKISQQGIFFFDIPPTRCKSQRTKVYARERVSN